MANQLRIGNGSFHIISGSLETGHIKFNSLMLMVHQEPYLQQLVYSGSNVTQVTQSYEAGTTQKQVYYIRVHFQMEILYQ